MNLLQCVIVRELPATAFSAVSGTVLTIFFKKNFRLQNDAQPHLPLAMGLGILWAPAAIYALPSPVQAVQAGLTALCVLKEMRVLTRVEQIKALVLSSCVLLPSVAPDCPQLFSLLAVGCATTQFLRWPVALKDFLRELRIICGPTYVLLVVGAAWAHFGRTPSSVLPIVAASLASFASVFLRPDNSEVVQRLGLPTPSTSARKLSHGAFMFSSFVCITAHSLWFHDSSATYWAVGFGLANSLLYLSVADFPRKCFGAMLTRLRPWH